MDMLRDRNSENNYEYYELDENSRYYKTDADREASAKRSQKKARSRMWKRAAAIAASAMLFGSVAGASYQMASVDQSDMDTVQASETEDSSSGQASMQAYDVSDVVEKVMPSVVAITNISVEEVPNFFYGTLTYDSESSGSGFIIGQNDTELLIGTNNHVVEDATDLSVCFSVDTESLEDPEDAVVSATVKGTNSERDLAVIAVNLEDIPDEVMSQIAVAEMGSSSDLSIGEPAIAIGNALGYGQSVTLGIISALDREVSVEDGDHTVTNTMIQTDAAINFGNSGGVLVNAQDR